VYILSSCQTFYGWIFVSHPRVWTAVRSELMQHINTKEMLGLIYEREKKEKAFVPKSSYYQCGKGDIMACQ